MIGELLSNKGIKAIAHGDYQFLFVVAITLGVIVILDLLSSLILGYGGAQSIEIMQQQFSDHVFSLSISKLQPTMRGDLSSRLINDISNVSKIISVTIPDIVLNGIIGIGTLTFLFYINWKLTLMMLGFVPLLVLINYPIDKKIEKLFNIQQQVTGKINDRFTETLANIKLVKSYNAEKQEHYRFYDLFKEFKKSFKNIICYGVSLSTLSEVSIYTYILFIMLFLVYQNYKGNVVLSEIMVFFIYIFQVIAPLMSLQGDFSDYFGAKASYLTLCEVFDINDEAARNKVTNSLDGSVIFEDVSFGYELNHLVLNDLSFKIANNQLVSIIGPSGVGKTTIFSLLEKYYTNYSGTIRVGEQNLSEISTEKIREIVSYVSQDSRIIPGTIRDNLTYGKNQGVTDEAIDSILEQVGLSQLILSSDLGLDTQIGNGGNLLSEGQKQKINIARALLSHPKILLMDEISANLDVESEEEILNAIEAYKGELTIILIAHRLKTIVDSDQIIVLGSNGRVISSGTHQQLMSSSSYYRKIFEKA